MATQEKAGVDYLQLAADVDTFREMMGVYVAGLVMDGFKDREARALIAGVFSNHINKSDDKSDEEE